jgi:hypothetical protein
LSADELRFDSAGQTPATSPTCANCKQPIRDSYYEVGGHILCANCKAAIESKLGVGAAASAGAMMNAVGFGVGAAIAGATLYWAVAYFAHVEVGLIAIAVGYVVGRAVRAGSQYRGGLKYQLLAVGLTYAAISAAYVAIMVTGSTLDLGLGSGIVLLLTAPFVVVVGGLPSSLISLIIIGVGLQQAWHLNRLMKVDIKGPFKIGAAPAPASPPRG